MMSPPSPLRLSLLLIPWHDFLQGVRAQDSLVLQAYVKPPTQHAGVEGGSFGASTALSEDGLTLAVGDRAEPSCSAGIITVEASVPTDNGCSMAGAVVLYTRAGATWSFDAYIKRPKAIPAAGPMFGDSVLLSGDTLAVGAWGDQSCSTGIITVEASVPTDVGCAQSGAVYLYTRAASTWSFDAYIKPQNSRAGLQFSRNGPALSGDTLVVGQGDDTCSTGIVTVAASVPTDTGCTNAGSVHVYRRVGATWSFDAYIKGRSSTRKDRAEVAHQHLPHSSFVT